MSRGGRRGGRGGRGRGGGFFQDLPFDPELQIDTTPTALFPVSCSWAFRNIQQMVRKVGSLDWPALQCDTCSQ